MVNVTAFKTKDLKLFFISDHGLPQFPILRFFSPATRLLINIQLVSPSFPVLSAESMKLSLPGNNIGNYIRYTLTPIRTREDLVLLVPASVV